MVQEGDRVTRGQVLARLDTSRLKAQAATAEAIGFTAQRLMALEVGTLTGVAPGARSADRINHRNDYRDRDWETGPERSNSAFRSCEKEAIFLTSSNHAG
jgi:hypothetical protein